MATAVGNLIVRLGAQTGQFDKKMRVATGVVGRFGSRVVGMGRRLAMFGAGLAGVVGVGGMALFVKRQFAAVDAAAKLSQQLGISTESLAGLRHAAELTGAGAGSLDAALATLSKRLGEGLRRGSGPAVEALTDLGLSIEDIAAKRPDDAFRAIAGAITRIESPIKRNAIAANLFSKANMGLVNTLMLGKEGLADIQAEAERLGLTFSAVDAAKIEAANDAITRMKGAIGGVFRTLAIKLAPAVEKFAGWVTAAGPKIIQLGAVARQTFRFIMGYVTTAGRFLMDVFSRAFSYVSGLLAPLQSGFSNAFQSVIGNLDVMLGSWEGFREGVATAAGQAAAAFMAAFELVRGFMEVKARQILGIFETLFSHYIQLAARAAVEYKMWKEEIPEVARGVIRAGMAVAHRQERTGIEGRTNTAVEDLRKKHEGRMAAIGEKSLAISDYWSKQRRELPKLSDAIREAWRAAVPPEITIPALAAVPPMEGMAGVGGVGGVGGKMFAGAAERGSAEAWTRILSAMGGGKKGPAEETAKHTKHIANGVDRTAAAVERMEDGGGDLREIPAG